MRFYTTHLPPHRLPVLVREGFSVWAALFGGVWLLLHAAWVPGLLLLALDIAVFSLVPPPFAVTSALALFVLQGLLGSDLRRWGLALQGAARGPVIAAANLEAALLRLAEHRPDLFAGTAGPLR